MNLDRFNPSGWTAQFTLDLVKHQEEAERFFREGEALYAKLKKERSALGSLEDAKIADELAAKNLQEAGAVLASAEKAATDKIADADQEIESRKSALNERERSLALIEADLEARRKQLNAEIGAFEKVSLEKNRVLEKESRELRKQQEVLERRQKKCQRVLALAADIAKIKL